MWVTVLASQPSVSIETETTQRTCSPSLPGLPTVFITSRSRSSSVSCRRPRRGSAAVLGLELLDLPAAIFLKSAHRLAGLELGGVDQDRAGRSATRPSSRRWRSSAEVAGHGRPLAVVEHWSQPAIQSYTSFDTIVFGQTTMITGGGSPRAGGLPLGERFS
jgi:hypothetical protein